MLLGPPEEQFDFPAAFVKLGDGKRVDIDIVGQEPEIFFGFGIEKFDQTKLFRIIFGRLRAG
jgi:hypothetical protein